MLSRRKFLQLGLAASASALFADKLGQVQNVFAAPLGRYQLRQLAAQIAQTPLAGSMIPQFIDPVPNLLAAESLIVDDGSTQIVLEMREHKANVLPAGTVAGYAATVASANAGNASSVTTQRWLRLSARCAWA